MAILQLSDLHQLIRPLVGEVLTQERALDLVARIRDLAGGAPLPIKLVAPLKVGSYTLRPERLSATLDELRPLHRAHWEETESYRHGLPFAPDYVAALEAETSGQYLLIAVRKGTDLVGNYGMWLTRSRHTQTLVAQEDTVFLAGPHRRGRLFVRLAEYAETVAMMLGARELRVSTKVTNKVGDMLPRMGYTHVANQYVKFLE